MVEAWGRRNLLLFGAIGMAVCQFIVAITGTVTSVTDLPAQRSMIAFVCIYIFFFACSWGPVAWGKSWFTTITKDIQLMISQSSPVRFSR